MKSFVACMLAVLLWTGAHALAGSKGQGKGQSKDAPTEVKDRTAEVQEKTQDLAKNAEKNMGKARKEAKDIAEEAKGGKGGKGKDAEKLSDAVEKGKGKGKGAEKQLGAFQKQLQREQAKHMERAARLNRIRELAVQKGDAETVARVDKLIQKEQQVYDRKLKHLQGQPRATQQPPAGTESVAPVPAVPAPGDSSTTVPNTQKQDANQPSNK